VVFNWIMVVVFNGMMVVVMFNWIMVVVMLFNGTMVVFNGMMVVEIKICAFSHCHYELRLGSTVVDLSQQGSYRFIREGCAR